MSNLKFYGAVVITDSDDYGTMNLKLAMDLLNAIKRHAAEEIIEGKATNIIKVCCEPEIQDLGDTYEWDSEEIRYADDLLAKCIEVATFELLEIAMKRITHKQKIERRNKLRIEDMVLAGMMAYLMNVHNRVSDRVEDAFMEKHGAMYFKT